jgi:integrase
MSVRKRTWTTGKGVEKSAWVVDYTDGKGARRLKSFKLKKEADAFASTAAVEVREGTHVADSASVTVEKAAKFWITSGEAAGLERSTINQRQRHLDHHIIPFIGQTLLSRLTIPTIRDFEDKLRSEGRSPAMIKKVVGSLGSILSDAQERGLGTRNPVKDMRGTRRPAARTDKRHKTRIKVGEDIPTREEIKALVGALEGRWRPLLITAIFTGMRSSELRGLRWKDVDLDRRTISVRQRADEFGEIGRPKSGSGERTIPVPPIVVNALKEWRLAYGRPVIGEDEGGNSIREEAKPDHLVFGNGLGHVESRGNIINRGLVPAMIRAGVTVPTGEVGKDGKPKVAAKYSGLHSLRHFYASWCINRPEDGGLGLPAKVVQERLGHSSIVLTLDVYGHLFPSDDNGDELAAAEAALLN